MFFWVIVTCHAAWSDCERSVQPDFATCMDQAQRINENTDAVAICTVRSDGVVRGPAAWAVQEARDDE